MSTEVEVAPASATTPLPTPEEAGQALDRRLRKYRDIRRAIDRVNADADAQVEEILEWRNEQVRQLSAETDRLELDMAPLARVVIDADPRGKKSAKRAGGSVGWRAKPRRLAVEDQEVLVAWAKQHLPECVRTVERVDLHVLGKAAAEAEDGGGGAGRLWAVIGVDGADEVLAQVPAVHVERGADEFYVEPSP